MARLAFSRTEQTLLDKVVDMVCSLDPEARVVLYGSHARGDATPESDWDVLVLLSGPADLQRENEVRDCLFDLGLEMDTAISAIVHSEAEWYSARWRVVPLHMNIEDEGINLTDGTSSKGSGALVPVTDEQMAEARDELVQEWLSRARTSLTAAEILADEGLWNESVSRLYYACFDAVRALLLQRGHRFSKHSSVQASFNRNFGRSGLVPREFFDLYNTLFKSRGQADYEAFVRFDEPQVRLWMVAAQEFVDTIEGLLHE